METRVFKEKDISAAADLIRGGGIVAVPTETVYGLACDGRSDEAVRRVYDVKGRPEVKPLSLMVPSIFSIERYCVNVPDAAFVLAKRFWPGPLTIVLESRDGISPVARAGGKTVGLRCPDHPLTLQLLERAAVPMAAPSANPSGSPSPKSAGEVLAYFNGVIDGIVDGGECDIGTESTVFDLTGLPYRVLRAGALSEAEVAACLCDAMTIIGITGGTGSGKTSVLSLLEKRGALIIDCDEVYHELLDGCGELVNELSERFPGVVSGGRLERRKLGEIVFDDAEALADLNAITHKYVSMQVNARLSDWAMRGGRVAAVDAIALLKSDLADRCAAIVGITAPTQDRIRRIMEREAITREYAEMRISAQKPNEYFEEHCDYIIHNAGGMDELAAECDRVFDYIFGGIENGKS